MPAYVPLYVDRMPEKGLPCASYGHLFYIYGAINGRLWPYKDTGFLVTKEGEGGLQRLLPPLPHREKRAALDAAPTGEGKEKAPNGDDGRRVAWLPIGPIRFWSFCWIGTGAFG